MITVMRIETIVLVHDDAKGNFIGWVYPTEGIAQEKLLETQQQASEGGILCQAIYCGRDSYGSSVPQQGHELMAMLNHAAHLIACLAEAGERPDVERLLFSFGLVEQRTRQQLEAFAAQQNAELQHEVATLRRELQAQRDANAVLQAANTALDLLCDPSGTPAIERSPIEGECTRM